MKVGDLLLGLGVDSADFKTAVTKAAGEAGDAGGKTLASRMGAALKGASVAIGAGLAIATKGALEAEQAQGKFMAATGASREEAKKFVSEMDSLAGSSGTVGRSFDEIAAVGTEVARQFKLTGEEGAAMTEKFLEFSKVTGQDAVAAVEGLDGTLDAFHLPAEAAVGLMDQFIASNQEFGTDVGPETISQLNKMAPALQAMGMGIDDGIGLLNLFEDAGLDAAGATKGLNAAIANIPPGETLETVLAHIQAIEDPLERAQAAAEIFGAKAGAGLANALKPGGKALDDYIITTEEAAGATQKASDDMLTLGDRIKGFADKALAGAREIGNEFGPAITGFASLTSLAAPFAKGLAGLFSGLVSKVLPSAVAVGVATGTAEGEAHVAAATGPTMVKSLFTRLAAMAIPLAPAGTTIGTAVGGAMAVATAAAWAAGLVAGGLIIDYAPVIGVELGRAFVTKGFQDEFIAAGRTAATNYAAGYSAEVRDHAGQVFEDAARAALASGATDAAALHAGELAVKQYLAGFEKAIPATSPDFVGPLMGAITPPAAVVEETADQTAGSFNTGFVGGIADREADMHNAIVAAANAAAAADAAMYQPFVDLGKGIVSKLTQTLWDDRDKLTQTANNLRDILKNGMTPEALALEAIGADTIKLFRKGMVSQKTGAQETAEMLAATSIKAIVDTANGTISGKGAKAVGAYLGGLFEAGMDSKQIDALLSGAGLSEEAIQGIHSKFPQFFAVGSGGATQVNTGFSSKPWAQWGRNMADNWVDAFAARLSSSKDQINHAVRIGTGGLVAFSPPKTGPLKHIDDWGYRTGSAWVEGFVSALGGGGLAAATMPLADALSSAAGQYGGLDGQLRIQHDVNLNVPPESAQALRANDYDETAIGRALGDFLSGAERAAGMRWGVGS